MKIIEHDVILVNKLTKASTLMELTESFRRYIMLKESGSPKKTHDETKQQECEKKTKITKKIINNVSKKTKKSPKEEDSKKEKKMKPAVEIEKEGEFTCDCDC